MGARVAPFWGETDADGEDHDAPQARDVKLKREGKLCQRMGAAFALHGRMSLNRPTLAQALDEDRRAYERSLPKSSETGLTSLSGRLQDALGLGCPMRTAGSPKLRRRPF